MTEITHVERYTIPLERSMAINEGTTVSDLIAALAKLPSGGIVSQDMGGSNLFVTFENKPIRT